MERIWVEDELNLNGLLRRAGILLAGTWDAL